MNKKGFTLIELLVVISIISLMSTIVLASLSNARKKARDTQRMQETRAIKTALEAYYSDNGRYPQTGWVGSHQSAWESGVLGVALEPYLPTMPRDPINTNTAYAYTVGTYNYSYYASGYGSAVGNQQWYMLVYNVELTTPTQANDGSRACDGTVFTYSVSVVVGGNCIQ
ncbi:MAG: hypothetical protein K0S38_859 [Candidatus Paceibacter sp.]|jgi:type II secretion system protein G|nr:hypothetical protein [Candidatus Paceibacter sp.]